MLGSRLNSPYLGKLPEIKMVLVGRSLSLHRHGRILLMDEIFQPPQVPKLLGRKGLGFRV